MVAIRFFITEQLIVSTRHRRVYAIEQVVRNLRQVWVRALPRIGWWMCVKIWRNRREFHR